MARRHARSTARSAASNLLRHLKEPNDCRLPHAIDNPNTIVEDDTQHFAIGEDIWRESDSLKITHQRREVPEPLLFRQKSRVDFF